MTRFPILDIRHPQPFDILDDHCTVVGMLNTGDTGVAIHLLDADGNDIVPPVNVGAGMNGGGEIHASFVLSSAPTATGTVRVAVFGGGESVDIEVTYGSGIVPSYGGYAVHEVVGGDTLSGIAAEFYGDENRWPIIATANRDVVADPDLIFPGQELRLPVDATLPV